MEQQGMEGGCVHCSQDLWMFGAGKERRVVPQVPSCWWWAGCVQSNVVWCFGGGLCWWEPRGNRAARGSDEEHFIVHVAGNPCSTLLNLPSSIKNHQDQATSLACRGTKLKKPVAVMLLESVWLHLSCFSTIWVNKLRH